MTAAEERFAGYLEAEARVESTVLATDEAPYDCQFLNDAAAGFYSAMHDLRQEIKSGMIQPRTRVVYHHMLVVLVEALSHCPYPAVTRLLQDGMREVTSELAEAVQVYNLSNFPHPMKLEAVLDKMNTHMLQAIIQVALDEHVVIPEDSLIRQIGEIRPTNRGIAWNVAWSPELVPLVLSLRDHIQGIWHGAATLFYW